MRRFLLKYSFLGICLFLSNKSSSQTFQAIEQISNLLNDATYFSDKYITPATDGAVYQASSSWMSSPKKRKLWATTIALHGNLFVVPNRDREFQINNSDFSFFTLENGNSSQVVPTALGNDNQYYLTGNIDGNAVRLQTPKGINQEQVIYPYLQGSISLWKGTEIVGKYSTKVKLKRGDYQVYGVGVKHNISQYVKPLVVHKINIAGLLAYSKENISFDFLDTQTPYGTLGINRITGLVDTWQFQMSASKEWKRFELMISSITNRSEFEYKLTGDRGTIEDFIPVQYILNEKLKEIYKTKYNSIAEVSGRYKFSNFYVQGSLAFGKFVNTNLSFQYEFN